VGWNDLRIAKLRVGSGMKEQEMITRTKDFALRIMKLVTVEEEADESAFWMELIMQGKLMPEKQVAALLSEAGELTAVAASSKKTASAVLRHSQIANRKSQIS
jgi:hypothetical protein